MLTLAATGPTATEISCTQTARTHGRTHARTHGRTDKAIPRARLPSLKTTTTFTNRRKYPQSMASPLPIEFGLDPAPLPVICGFNPAPLPLPSSLNPALLPILSGSNSAPLPVLGGFNPAPLPDTCGIIQHHCQTKVVIIQHRLPVISAKEARTFQLFQLI